MTETKSCLNCLHGKTEKQPKGYYCKLPAWDYAANRFDSYPCWHYKPRPNQCEIDGCRWMVEGKCTFSGCHNVSYTGQPCTGFEQQEAEMEQIEFQGKVYERTGQVLTLYTLFNDARGCSDITHAVWLFSKKHNWFDYHADITISKRDVMWIKSKPGILSWLVEHGYLKEVEEEKQKPNQWYKTETDVLYLSDFQLNLINPISGGHTCWTNWKFTPTSIKIVEQPEPAERRPEKCHYIGRDNTCFCNRSMRFNINCRADDADNCGCWRA